MSTIVTRAGKGSPLTNNEVDSNFTNLNSDKVETVTSVDGSVVLSRVGTSVDFSVGISSSTGNLIAAVRNETGATLTKGTIVYPAGASGNKMLVQKALATSDATSAQTYGMIQADIPNNQNGFVVISGLVSGLNTSGLTEGGILYLSPTTAGGYTQTKPYAPNHLVYVGIVTRVHATQGEIQTRIQNGYELDEIHDVQITSIANDQVLQYESSTTLWKNKTLTTSSITEGTNLYYTDARVRAAISGTAPVSFNSTTGAISMAAATSSVNGYLTSTDWSTFNAKQDALVSGSNIKTINSTSLLGSGDISIPIGDPAGTAVAMAIALG